MKWIGFLNLVVAFVVFPPTDLVASHKLSVAKKLAYQPSQHVTPKTERDRQIRETSERLKAQPSKAKKALATLRAKFDAEDRRIRHSKIIENRISTLQPGGVYSMIAVHLSQKISDEQLGAEYEGGFGAHFDHQLMSKAQPFARELVGLLGSPTLEPVSAGKREVDRARVEIKLLNQLRAGMIKEIKWQVAPSSLVPWQTPNADPLLSQIEPRVTELEEKVAEWQRLQADDSEKARADRAALNAHFRGLGSSYQDKVDRQIRSIKQPRTLGVLISLRERALAQAQILTTRYQADPRQLLAETAPRRIVAKLSAGQTHRQKSYADIEQARAQAKKACAKLRADARRAQLAAGGQVVKNIGLAVGGVLASPVLAADYVRTKVPEWWDKRQARVAQASVAKKAAQDLRRQQLAETADQRRAEAKARWEKRKLTVKNFGIGLGQFAAFPIVATGQAIKNAPASWQKFQQERAAAAENRRVRRQEKRRVKDEKRAQKKALTAEEKAQRRKERQDIDQFDRDRMKEANPASREVVNKIVGHLKRQEKKSTGGVTLQQHKLDYYREWSVFETRLAELTTAENSQYSLHDKRPAYAYLAKKQKEYYEDLRRHPIKLYRLDLQFADSFRRRTCRDYNHKLVDKMTHTRFLDRSDSVAKAWSKVRYQVASSIWNGPEFAQEASEKVDELLAAWKDDQVREEMRRRLRDFEHDASLGRLDHKEKPLAPYIPEDRVTRSLTHMALWEDFSATIKHSSSKALADNLDDTFLGMPLASLVAKSQGREPSKDDVFSTQEKHDLVWNRLLGLGLTERVKDFLASGRSDYGHRAVKDLLERYTATDVVGLEESWVERKRQLELLAGDGQGGDDSLITMTDDDNKLLDSDHRDKFQRNIYQPFPYSLSRHVDAEERCHCGQALDWDLVPAGDVAVDGRQLVRPNEFIQVPGPGTHKFSSCGHLLCARCSERRFQDSLVNLDGGYACPTCKVPVPFWDLHQERRIDRFGIDYGRVRQNFATPRNRRLVASLVAESESWLGTLQDKVGKRVGKWESLGVFFGSRYEQFALRRLTRSAKQKIRELATPVLADLEGKKSDYHQNLEQVLVADRGTDHRIELLDQPVGDDQPWDKSFEEFSLLYQTTTPRPVDPTRFSDFYAFARHHSGEGVFDDQELAYLQLSDTLVPDAAVGALADPKRWEAFVAKLNCHFDAASNAHFEAQLAERRAFLAKLNGENRRGKEYMLKDFHDKPLIPPVDSFRPYGGRVGGTLKVHDRSSQSSGIGQGDISSLRDGFLQEVRAASIALEGIIEGEMYRQSAAGRARLTDAKKRVPKSGRARLPGERDYFKDRKAKCRDQIDKVADDYFAKPQRTVADLRAHLKLKGLDNRLLGVRTQHRRQVVEQKKLVKGAELLKDEGLKLMSDRLMTAPLWQPGRGMGFEAYIADPRAVDHAPISWPQRAKIKDELIALLMELSTAYAQQLDHAVTEDHVEFADAVVSLKSRKEELLREFDRHIDRYQADIARSVAGLHRVGALRRLRVEFERKLTEKLRDWQEHLVNGEKWLALFNSELRAYGDMLDDAQFDGLDDAAQKKFFVKLHGEIGLRVLEAALRIADQDKRSDGYLASEARRLSMQMEMKLTKFFGRCALLPEGPVRTRLEANLKVSKEDCEELNNIAQADSKDLPGETEVKILKISQRYHDTLQNGSELFGSLSRLAEFSKEIELARHVFNLGGRSSHDREERQARWNEFLARVQDFQENLRPGVSETEVADQIAEWTQEISAVIDQVLEPIFDAPLMVSTIPVPPSAFLSSRARILVWESLPAANLRGEQAWALYNDIPEDQRAGLSAPRAEELSGLENLGATCFINSIIKAFATTSLYELLRPSHQLVRGDDESDDAFRARGDFKAALFEFVNQVRRGEKFLDVARIVDRILALKPDGASDYYSHRDAQEYLALVLNQLDGMRSLGFTEKTTIERLDQYGDVEKTEKSDPALMLTLPIGKDAQTLDEVLTNYTAKSVSHDLKAPQTRIEVENFGQTVIVHLVRFGNEGESTGDLLLQKNAAPVILRKLQKFSSQSPREYRLEGAFIHYGIGETPDSNSKELDFGHYTFLETDGGSALEHNDEQTIPLKSSRGQTKAYTGYVLIFKLANCQSTSL